MSARVILLRHGETDHNAGARMQGQLDVPLNGVGRAQAARAAAVLADLQPGRIVSSDLGRAAATAQVLATVLDLPVELDARLRETHLGEWEGLRYSEVRERWPEHHAEWSADTTLAPPGGESRLVVAARGHAVVLEIAESEAPVVLVAHGGLIAATTASALGLPPEHWRALGGLGNARWAELSRRGARWRLEGWNVGD